MAFLRRARRSEQRSRRRGVRRRARAARVADVGRPLVRLRRRRHGLGRDRLRRRARSGLRRHGQRHPVEPPAALRGPRRQSVPLVRARAQSRHRRVHLALPRVAGRVVGLHVGATDDARRSHDRRRAAQDAAARAEERLLLRARPPHGQGDLREQLRARELGHARRSRDGPTRDHARTRSTRTARSSRRRWRPARTTGRRGRSAREPASCTFRRSKRPCATRCDPNWRYRPGDYNLGQLRSPEHAARDARTLPPPEQLRDRVGSGGRGAALQDRRPRRRRARDCGRSAVPEPRQNRRRARRIRRDQRRASLEPPDAERRSGAAPISYSFDGEQYIAISTGRGSRGGGDRDARMPHPGRLVAFKLGGTATLPAAGAARAARESAVGVFRRRSRAGRRAALSRALQPLPRRRRAQPQRRFPICGARRR